MFKSIFSALFCACFLLHSAAFAEPFAKIGDEVYDTDDYQPKSSDIKLSKKAAKRKREKFDEDEYRKRVVVHKFRSIVNRELRSHLAPDCQTTVVEEASIDAYIVWWRQRVEDYVTSRPEPDPNDQFAMFGQKQLND